MPAHTYVFGLIGPVRSADEILCATAPSKLLPACTYVFSQINSGCTAHALTTCSPHQAYK
eukprot:545245-Pelagomonas_calceolata.AAC.1